MKRWRLRILSAFLGFIVGSSATYLWRVRCASAARIEPVAAITNHRARLRLTQRADAEKQTVFPMRPHRVSISPYEIKRLIDENNLANEGKHRYELNLKPIWQQLSLENNTDEGFPFDTCEGSCEAEIFKLELNGEPGQETVLRLYGIATWDYSYLVFKAGKPERGTGAEWTILGKVDAYGRYDDPECRVVTAGQQRWLAVNQTFGHGSGFGSHVERWYEISERGIAEVLAYQSGLFIAPLGNTGIDRRTKLLRATYKDGVAVIVLQSSTTYEAYLEGYDLFPVLTTRRKATFIKGLGMPRFVFDRLHSEITAIELDQYYGEEANISDEEFLEYNYRELAGVAAKGNAKQRAWLRNHLDCCDDSPEKQSLQRALRR